MANGSYDKWRELQMKIIGNHHSINKDVFAQCKAKFSELVNKDRKELKE